MGSGVQRHAELFPTNVSRLLPRDVWDRKEERTEIIDRVRWDGGICPSVEGEGKMRAKMLS